MRVWGRVTRDMVCGGCGARITIDSPAVLLTIPGVKRERARCEGCEGEAPPDLPFKIETKAPTLDNWDGMRKMTKEFGGKIWKRG